MASNNHQPSASLDTQREETTVKGKPKLSKDSLQKAVEVFRYVLPFKWSFLLGMFFLAAGSLLFLAIMKVPGEIFNVISNKSSYNLSLNQLFMLLLGLLGVQSVMSYFRVQLFALVSEKSMALLRTDLYEKLISLPITFFEERRSGELSSRLTNDVTQVQGIFSITLAEFIRQLIVLLGGVGIIVFSMPRLALTMLATFPLVVIVAMYFGRYIRKLSKGRQDELAQSNVVVEETIQSIQTVKAYTNEWFERQRYVKSLTSAVRTSLKAAQMRGLFAAFIIFVMFGALFFIMWRAALMVQQGEMLEGELVDFVVFTGIIGGSIASLGTFYTEIVAAVGATERIVEILHLPSELSITPDSQHSKRRLSGKISYEGVHFSYPTRPDVAVLKGINFTIQPGQRIALVGASGSGKSTIVSLLLRFYPVERGSILVDDQQLQTYELNELRQNMAIVPQEVLLFGGTIKENIRYGKPDATEAEVEAAARKANAWEFIDGFPEKFDTLVGERGIKLSGGQRQRIAIARAILKDPAILLLDEATSSLDAESEKVVQDALNVLMGGRTSIIVAHRLSTIRDVDVIHVIDKGKIIESGTHEQLSAIPDGAYSTLLRLQFQES